MNLVLRGAALTVLCLSLTGCPALFDALIHNGSPSGLTASTGQGYSINLSWSKPYLADDDEREVTDYEVYRGGSQIATTSSTSYSDSSVNPATQYSYTVSANFDDGSSSNESSSATGWYVPGEVLKLISQPTASLTNPGTHNTSEGWFRTMVVEGWTYHFDAGATTTLQVCLWNSPWNGAVLTEGPPNSFTWVADRTGEVWLRTGSGTSLRGWFE